KELVENALDAGARRVDVAVEKGGKRRIRVADDGVGMSREDAVLSLDRHATSKIREARDLRSVDTFGFRGEAIPSIAAVSRMTIETCETDEDVGTRIRVEGGKILGVEDTARSSGTTVEVERLFFNAPARAKFLKAVGAETRAVSDAVTTLALANPAVAFTLESGGRRLLDLGRSKKLAARIADLWGEEEAGALIPVSGEEGEITLRGLIQRPDAASPGFRRSYLFVNGRPFRDPSLIRAADRGYHTTVAPDVRPWIFLYLQVRPGAVDVNVHPTKEEVRFRDSGAVEAMVEGAVRGSLSGDASAATLDTQLAPSRMAVREGRGGEGRGGDGSRGGSPGEAGAVPSSQSSFSSGSPRSSGSRAGEGQMALFVSSRRVGKDQAEGVEEEGGKGTEVPEAGEETLPEAAPRLFQVHRTWIVAETRDGLLLIDQHSAHERILYERLMNSFESGEAGSQRLLFPLTIRLSGPEYEQVLALEGLLERAGFEVEGFGGNTVIVQAVPNPHPYFDAERCFREMVDELTHGSELVRSAHNQHDRIAKTFACKGAIKAGQLLSREEMVELVDQLFATELPHHDVHGRPTIVRLSRAELERKFGR
ncbi:MAG: DNA mismatch repair endonuclease MutL, partial [Longimicrobiales bacterium]|nr:DNA mismatch repair endonuclease MutL [Longimicrobiales bacterium]